MYERFSGEEAPKMREKRYPEVCGYCGTPNPDRASRCPNCEALFGVKEPFPEDEQVAKAA